MTEPEFCIIRNSEKYGSLWTGCNKSTVLGEAVPGFEESTTFKMRIVIEKRMGKVCF